MRQEKNNSNAINVLAFICSVTLIFMATILIEALWLIIFMSKVCISNNPNRIFDAAKVKGQYLAYA